MAKVLLGPITLGLRGTRDEADVDMGGEYSLPVTRANRIPESFSTGKTAQNALQDQIPNLITRTTRTSLPGAFE